MTKAEIEAMPGGREINMLIAEWVMGWRWMSRVGHSPNSNPYRSAWLFPPDSEDADTGEKDMFGQPIIVRKSIAYPGIGTVGPFQEYDGGRKETSWTPDYSGDISAAWLVVEKMRPTHGFWIDGDDGYEVEFQHGMVGAPEFRIGTSKADTAPLAICRAALLAILPA